MIDLNPAQQAAVEAPPGPVLVLAGAGSGKTRVIVHRAARRSKDGKQALLVTTFTNKAAKELRRRVAELGTEGVDVGTFHSVGLRLLRQYGSAIGLPDSFPLIGEDDGTKLIRRLAGELGVPPGLMSPKEMRSRVSKLKNRRATDESAVAEPAVMAVLGRYQAELERSGAVDLDDLIIRQLELLRETDAVRPWEVLLVDEYQDTSPLQFELVQELCPSGDVFAVGDDDQSIYSFRGADFQNILRFEQDFPGARIFRLEENYRSTGTILAAANAVVARNRQRHGKQLRAIAGRGRPIKLARFGAEVAEAHFVAGEVVRLGEQRGQAAVLLRVRSQTRAYEEAFVAHQVPHRVIGGLRFYERKEVLDALAHIQLALHPGNEVAFRRALGSLRRGIGPAALARIEARARKDLCPFEQAALAEGVVSGRAATNLRTFLDGVERVRAALSSGPAAVARAAVEDTGLGDDQEPERLENLDSLRTAASDYQKLNPEAGVQDWLDQVGLLSAEDFIDEGPDQPVLVMTAHAAKGLEFDTVFLGGLAEGVFPHALGIRENNLEEERRLFYVGITRARSNLYLLAGPGSNRWNRDSHRPSRFLAEIPGELFAKAEAAPGGPSAGFRKGEQVRHGRFGVGTVESVDPDGTRVTVLFRLHGRRRLVLAYAKLERA